MNTMQKLEILTGAARYDAACTSSGVDRKGTAKGLGSTASCGICHSFSSDGRCISLLKVLLSNDCVYDCAYCCNRVSNDVPRATFLPEELAELTINFYRRNYIEGLFLSSGVVKNSDYTMELLIKTLELLRNNYHFGGYIHAKVIPGADPALIERLGCLADRISVNIELPSSGSLSLLAPQKSKQAVLKPMGFIEGRIKQNGGELVKYRSAPKFAPAGMSTQMIVGASPESDYHILHLSEGLYKKYRLKRVFYSAYIPVNEDKRLPAKDVKPPLMREHRLYQADWLLRYYGFEADEILDEKNSSLSLMMDPKCSWAVRHLERFPVEVNRAPYEELLRVPGIGVTSARRILAARRTAKLDFKDLKKLGVVLKRAVYFITAGGVMHECVKLTPEAITRGLLSDRGYEMLSAGTCEQLSFLEGDKPRIAAENIKAVSGQF
jgi:putative DNA modification/repair radical SAM protein